MENDAQARPQGLEAYPAGHHSAVLTSHLSRNVENSASHLLPYLRRGMSVLDIGCGPGSITLSFVDHVGEEAKIVGVDPSSSVIEKARNLVSSSSSSSRYSNVEFKVGDAIAGLPEFEDGSFDVVHAHQVLEHVEDPIRMLREMIRLAKRPGGIISLREADMRTFVFHPDPTGLIMGDFLDVYYKITRGAGAQPDSGRRLPEWCRLAGIQEAEFEYVYASCLSYGQDRQGKRSSRRAPLDEAQTATTTTKEGVSLAQQRRWWGESWKARISDPDSGFFKTALEKGYADEQKLRDIGEAFRQWGESEDAFFFMVNGEVIARLQ